MELLFEVVFSLLFDVVLSLFVAAGEYALFRTHKRIWMWIFGLAAIGVMIWWRGSAFWTSWVLAIGWLAALVYLDRRMKQG